MYCERLSKMYQMVPNLFKVVDRLFYSEPFIEKMPTFEMKSFLTSYTFVVGGFFDERVKKGVRKLYMWFHIASSSVALASCTFYLADLTSYDYSTVALGVIPLIFTTAKLIYMFCTLRFFDSIKTMIQLFIDDYSYIQTSEPVEGFINGKKWIIVVSSLFAGFKIVGNILFSVQNQIEMNRFTRRTFFMKYFPIWCPFENSWAITLVSIFQDVIMLPASMIYLFGSLLMYLSIIELNNKHSYLFEKLRSLSTRTFERIELLENEIKALVEESSKGILSNKIKILEKERVAVVDEFYQNFLSIIERYQQLHRMKMLGKSILDTLVSVTYCFVFSVMIGFGFFGAEASSEVNFDLNTVIKMLAWFSVYGAAWYMLCLLGDIGSKWSDKFAVEVYSMPWYYFSPKQRKTVLILLTIIQKPVYLRAMKIVRVRMDLFPIFMNSVYNYVKIMRTLQGVRNHM